MGGVVAVTIRMSDRKQYRMRWGTSALYNLKRPGWFNPAAPHWPETLTRWSDPSLAHELAPSEYGLVVIDFVSQRILSANSFTAIDSEWVASESLDGAELSAEYIQQLRAAGQTVRLLSVVPRALRQLKYGPRGVTGIRSEEAKWEKYTDLPLDLDALTAELENVFQDYQSSFGKPPSLHPTAVALPHQPAKITWSLPLSVTDYWDTGFGRIDWTQVQQDVESMGFELSPAEREAWQKPWF